MTAEHPDQDWVNEMLDKGHITIANFDNLSPKERAQVIDSGVKIQNPLRDDLFVRFPWLKNLRPYANMIINTLEEKERHYRGSWQRRGGVGAFMMLARKWDRIESIAEAEHGYDILEAGLVNTGDVLDDIDDLVGYLLLVRAEIILEKEGTPDES